jgi:hypothetical protein
MWAKTCIWSSDFAAVQPGAPGGLQLRAGDGAAVGVDGQQQAGFFEGLAHGRGVPGQAALRQAQAGIAGRLVAPGADAGQRRIRRIQQPAREHPGAAVLVAALGAAHQQDLRTLGGITGKDEGGGGAERGGGHGNRLRTARPPCCPKEPGAAPQAPRRKPCGRYRVWK